MKEYIGESLDGKNSIINISLYSIVLVYPFIIIPNTYGYFYFPRFIFLILMSIFSFPILFKIKENPIKKRELFLLLFIFFMLISSAQAFDIHTAFVGLYGMQVIETDSIKHVFTFTNTARFTGFATYICYITLFLLASNSKNIDNIIKYMIYACTIVSIIAIMQHFGLNIVPHESFRNNFPPYGTIGQHNFLATYTVFNLIASIFYTLKNKSKYWFLISSIIYAGMLVSRTRGAWISFVVIFLITAVYCIKHTEFKKGFICLFLSFLLVTCILLPTEGGILYKRVVSIPVNISSGIQLDDSAGSARMYIWKHVIKLVPKYWAFGIGPDNLINAGILLNDTPVDKSHNIYLEIFITMGVFTLISYLLFLSTFIKKNMLKDENVFMLTLMILTYLIQGFFNIDVIMVMPYFWIVLGVYVAYEKEKEDILI